MGQAINQDQYTGELTKDFKPLSFKDLCFQLREAFVPNHVDLELVNHLLLTYKSNPTEWAAYRNFDENVYTRNLVDTGNGKYNLIILCWNPDQRSPIHDHADCNCFMKILQGELVEVRFAKEQNYNPYTDGEDPKPFSRLIEVAQKRIKTNDVCYINDNIGFHQMVNPSKTTGAISLHLYCPPFQFCKVYEKSGEFKIAEMKFHTRYGQ